MKSTKSKIALLVLSLGGLCFSGYLSGIKFFTKTCAFNESCPYFLGYPACYYGFAMYLALTILSILNLLGKFNSRSIIKSIISVSGLGIIFAGYFTFKEIPILFAKGLTAYVLGLPTCALGLIFYITIFVIAIMSLGSMNQSNSFSPEVDEKTNI